MAKTRRPNSVDWSEVVYGLYRFGVTNTDVATKLDVSRQTVMQWQSGASNPSYENGVRLLGLWMMELCLDYSFVPRVSGTNKQISKAQA